ncbi:MAG: hypothetical protein AAF845_00045 [Bacteroidota bacterium]
MPRLGAVLALFLVAGCATTAPGPPERADLVGTWTMAQILDNGTDVSDQHNPAGDRFITLQPDGTFESGGQPYGRNTGRWIYDPATRELGLDSDAGPEDDSRWTVRLRGDRMEWQGLGSAFARRFVIVAERTG